MMYAPSTAPRTEPRPMQPPYGNAASDQYLLQKISGSTQEQLVSMLLEGAQRFVGQAILAMERRDIPAKARAINKASAIVEELAVWLNHEAGGDLVENLTRIYDWWLNELFEGAQTNQPERLERVQRQMGEIRATWDELQQRGQGASGPKTGLGADGVVG